MFDLDDCMAFVTSQSAKIFASSLEKRMRNFEINRTGWIALHYIYRSGSIIQRDLAELLNVKESSVARMVQKLESDGYVKREASPDDRRTNFLVLTKKGEEIYAQILPVVEQFKNDTIVGIGEDELSILKTALNKMVENALK